MLEQVIEDNRRSRREAAEQAEAIIDLQVDHYLAWWHASGHQETLRQLRQRGEAERDAALARAREALAQGRSAEDALEWLAHSLTNTLLHAPSANLRAAALRGDHDLLHAAARLFDTESNAAPAATDKEADDPQHPKKARSPR